MRGSIKVNQYSGWDIRTQNNVEDENEDGDDGDDDGNDAGDDDNGDGDNSDDGDDDGEDGDGDEDADETPALCCFSSWNTQEDFNFLMLSSCRGKSLISGSQGL